MAKKTSPKKTLRSLFTKSEASFSESPEKDKDEDKKGGEKKKSKFFKFKIKSKGSSEPEKPANESQSLASAAEPDKTAEHGDAWPDTSSPDSKRASLYATAPRSKVKDYSYSELDLTKVSKSKKLSSFSFNFGKSKKKNEEDFSKSTMGLHSPANKARKEGPANLRQLELDQSVKTATFSMSHPELDTTNKSDIPYAPPRAINQLKSPLTNQSQSSVPLNNQPASQETVMDISGPSHMGKEIGRAPIATIPELQLISFPTAENKITDNLSQGLYDSSTATTQVVSISAVDAETAPSISVIQPPTLPDASDHKASVPDSVSLSTGLPDDYIPQRSNVKADITLSEITNGALSLEPRVSEKTDNTAPSGSSSLEAVDSKMDAIINGPSLDNSAFNTYSAPLHNKVSVSCVETSNPETNTSVTATVKSVATGENSIPSDNKTAVYGGLYVPLFPQSFTSEILSSTSNSGSVCVSGGLSDDEKTEKIRLAADADTVVAENLNEYHRETNIRDCNMSDRQESDSSAPRMAVSGGLSDHYALQQANIKAGTSHYQTTTSSLAQSDGPEMADSTCPSGDSVLAAVDSKTDTVNAKPSIDNSAFNVDSLHKRALVSQVETSGITSVTTTHTSVNTGESGIPSASETGVYGSLYESLFPQRFASEVLFSSSNSDSLSVSGGLFDEGHTERIHLDTDSDPVVVENLNECRIESNITGLSLSTTQESDTAAPRMEDTKAGYINTDAKVTKIEVMSSTEATSALTKPNEHVFNALSESLHLPSSTPHQTPNTSDPGHLPITTQTASHHGNQPSSLNLNSEPDGQVSCDTDNIPQSEMPLSSTRIKSETVVHTEKIDPDTDSGPVMIENISGCCTETNIPDSNLSATQESASTVPRREDTKAGYIIIDANVTKTGLTSSSETSSTTSPKKHAFSALYESLHLPSSTLNQIPTTSDPGQLPSVMQSDSALHHGNQPSSLNLNSEPVGQDTNLTDNIPQSEMTLSSPENRSGNNAHTEKIHLDTSSGPINVENLSECHAEMNITNSKLSATHESDSTAPRMDDAKADYITIDTNVSQTEQTSSRETSITTKPKTHASSALYESLHLPSSTIHQTSTTSDPGQLPSTVQTDLALHQGNPPSSLNLNSDPVGQDTSATDHMMLSSSGIKSENIVHTEMIHPDTDSGPIMVENLNECHAETDITDSNLSATHESDATSPKMDDAKAGSIPIDGKVTKTAVSSSSETYSTVNKPKKHASSALYESLHLPSSTIVQTPNTCDSGQLASAVQTDSALHHGNQPCSLNFNSEPVGQGPDVTENIPPSEMSLSSSGIKSESIVHTEKTLDTCSGSVMVETLNKCGTNITDSSLSATHESEATAPRMADSKAGYITIDTNVSMTQATSTEACSTVTKPKKHAFSSLYESLFLPSFSLYQTPTTSAVQTDSTLHYTKSPSSSNLSSDPVGQKVDVTDSISYSEITPSHSEIKSSDTIASVPEVQNSAPPSSDYVKSPETDTQVTDSKHRAVFVRDTDTALTSAGAGCPSPMPKRMAAKGEEIDAEIMKEDTFSVPAGEIDGDGIPRNPVYISIGSDDGSAMDVYYSAEEDNMDDNGNGEMYTMDERKETSLSSSLVDKTKQVGLHVEIPQQEKMAQKEQNKGQDIHLNSVVDVDMRAIVEGRKNVTAVLQDSDVRKEEQESTKARLQLKEKGEERRKEELLASPVQQVNTLKECVSALPSSKPHGPGEGSEGNWTAAIHIQTDDHLNRQAELPGQEIKHRNDRCENTHNATTLTEKRDKIDWHTYGEAKELLTAEVEKTGEESKTSIQTNSSSAKSVKSIVTATNGEERHSAITETTGRAEVVTGTLTRSAELQSDARETEHNRAAQRSEWADTVTQSTSRASSVSEQVAVKLSVTSADTHHPDPEAADTLSERDDRPPAAHPSLPQGSLNASGVSRLLPEVLTSEIQQTKADLESADNMYSGYNTLSLKPSTPTHEDKDESKNRFHKVSLVTETDITDVSRDTVDFRKPKTTAKESNGTDLGSVTPEYKWRNRFEGVSQCKPTEQSSLSDSLNSTVYNTHSGTSSSALPEATVYTQHLLTSSPSHETHSSLDNRLTDRTRVYLSHESEPVGTERTDEWRRTIRQREESAAPAGEREGQRGREAEPEKIKSGWDSQTSSVSGLSSALQTSQDNNDSSKGDDSSSSVYSGVFKATRVELVTDPSAPSSSPVSPDVGSCDMDTLVDTLKSMGPSQRTRSMRGNSQILISALPPIEEDKPTSATSSIPNTTSPTNSPPAPGAPPEVPNGLYTLPPDLGLNWSIPKDKRSPIDLMKQSQQELVGNKVLNLPSRASAASSIVMRKPFDSSSEGLPNGNGVLQSSGTTSRLDNSVLFSSYRSASLDKTQENGKANPLAQRPFLRTGSLPETGPTFNRISTAPNEFSGFNSGADQGGSRLDRFSFLLNSSTSSSGSLTGTEDANSRMSRPSPLSISSPPSSNSPTRLLSPTGSIDLHRAFTTTDSPLSMSGQMQGMGMGVGTGALGTKVLQRSFSSEGPLGGQQSPLFNSVHGGSHLQIQEPEPERNLLSKYRAFPDAYLTKEKEHGKLNPRPGKMYIFDRPGMCGQRIEVRSDVIDATPWQLQETISIRVVRGGWVLYEKPNFKGEKIALDEGDIELTCPFNPPEEEEQNGQKEIAEQTSEQNGEKSDGQTEENKPARRFIIGSIRRAVRDYSVPDISLFPEENAEGKKVIFRDTSEDARIFGFPIKANSIIINAGLWLVYAQPFFQGVPRVLEVGGYSNPAAWGVEQPYVGSLHPLKIGEPRVENANEPKMVIYEKPYFTGKSRTITTTLRDFMTRTDRQQIVFMYSVGSLKVQGGVWVGYEKEGFRGHQYLLEEGEYHDWRVWGGCDSELRSVRVIQADLTDPLVVLFEQPDEERDDQEENTFEVTEAIPDVEMFGYKATTRSIQVVSGAWIAYSHVDFSGDQYILEKGFYNNCADWGSENNRICSIQPILLAQVERPKSGTEIMLYSEPDFQGECHVFSQNHEAVSDKLLGKSCRVAGGSWLLYDGKQHSGNMYFLSEGDYPNFASMGCPASCTIRSIKAVPLMFSVPSISLFGLECLEGREITTDVEVPNMVQEGFNNYVLSVRVNSGCWMIYEYSNFRGRQFLLEPIEITNWPKFSSLNTIGSMYPVRQKRRFFRIKNKERGHYMSIQGGVEEMKTGRVVVTPQVEAMSDIWFYQDGLIKSKMAPNMSLQVMGNVEPAAKVVLWSETRQPIQTWTAQMAGTISSLTFPGMILDVKGGKTYDKDHVVIMPESEERPSQQWELELL